MNVIAKELAEKLLLASDTDMFHVRIHLNIDQVSGSNKKEYIAQLQEKIETVLERYNTTHSGINSFLSFTTAQVSKRGILELSNLKEVIKTINENAFAVKKFTLVK